MAQFQVPASFEARVRKQPFTVTGIESWPVDSLAKVFQYGLQQLMNDAAASAETDAEAIELATKRANNLRDGILRASAIREGDPIRAEAIRIATAKIEKAIKASGRKVKDYASADIRKNALALLEKDPTILAAAKVAVEAAAGLSVTVDLSDLTLIEATAD